MLFVSITDDDKKVMLDSIGVKSIDELFKDIPDSIKLKNALDLPEQLSEIEVTRHLTQVAGNNKKVCAFLGGGAYQHYVPAVVDALSSRSEFYTAYTPYQPEVSQGTLTAIFEFQTMIARLTGMDISNASMYDGATALAESVIMVLKHRKKNKVLISNTLHPNYFDVLKTYCWASGTELLTFDHDNGLSDIAKLENSITEAIGAVVVQNPNFFGCIEELKKISDIVHEKKSQLIVVVPETFSLGLLKSPGSFGADVVCGEARGFGNYIGFGGPQLGFIASTREYMRKLPGRLVGKTVDAEGKTAYALTLQSREQHIRRERATSNICTNEGLVALRAVIYLSLIGNKLRDLAMLNHNIAGYLKRKLVELGFEVVFDRPYFNEFVVRHKDIKLIMNEMKKSGFIQGTELDNYYEEYKDSILVCATEIHSKEEIDDMIEKLRGIL